MKLSDRWREFKTRWEGCDKCPMHEWTHQKVHYRGDLPCDVLFIGEGPGTFENVDGKPFVGPAGIELDNIVKAAHNHVVDERPDLLDLRFGFANVVACMPCEGFNTPIREPSKDEAMRCRPRLLELVQMARPKAICVVGKVANKFVPPMPIPRAYIMHPAAMLRLKESGKQNLEFKRALLQVSGLMRLTVPKPET